MRALARKTFLIDVFFHPAQAQFILQQVTEYDQNSNPHIGRMSFRQKRMVMPQTTLYPKGMKYFDFQIDNNLQLPDFRLEPKVMTTDVAQTLLYFKKSSNTLLQTYEFVGYVPSPDVHNIFTPCREIFSSRFRQNQPLNLSYYYSSEGFNRFEILNISGAWYFGPGDQPSPVLKS